MKQCRNCEFSLSAESFHKQAASPDGLHAWCKECVKDYSASRYASRKVMNVEPPKTKFCAGCGYDYSEPQMFFKAQPLNADGLMNECQHCTKSRILLRKFGITLEKYKELSDAQNRKCAICRKHCMTGRALAVDHDHETGQVRGLLCAKCNRGLGMFNDSPELLGTAIDYLKERRTTDE